MTVWVIEEQWTSSILFHVDFLENGADGRDHVIALAFGRHCP
jgi:hypothetical protein